MLSRLVHRISLLATLPTQPIDPKFAQNTYEAVIALGFSSPTLHLWTVRSPPSPICAWFAARMARDPFFLTSPQMLECVHRMVPAEVCRVLDQCLLRKDENTNDLVMQCARRSVKLRPALSARETVAFLERFHKLGFRGHTLFTELAHRIRYVAEELTLREALAALTILSNVGKASPELWENIAERLVDILDAGVEGSSTEGDPALGDLTDTLCTFVDHGWSHEGITTVVVANLLRKQGLGETENEVNRNRIVSALERLPPSDQTKVALDRLRTACTI